MVNPTFFSGSDLASFLEERSRHYNTAAFIENDPVSVPHRFTLKQDIEIAGFIAATLAWGNRKTIIQSALRFIHLMDDTPYEFLMHAKPANLSRFTGFFHRTFNGDDALFFIAALQRIYRDHGSLEPLFGSLDEEGAAVAIHRFREHFLSSPHLHRSEKHLADPLAGSAAKRINMFLRWMVRHDTAGVDFGLWRSIDPANLVCPLDLHSGRVARQLGLLSRTQNDWKAAIELTNALRQFDPSDPVKFDFTLFGIGAEKR